MLRGIKIFLFPVCYYGQYKIYNRWKKDIKNYFFSRNNNTGKMNCIYQIVWFFLNLSNYPLMQTDTLNIISDALFIFIVTTSCLQ